MHPTITLEENQPHQFLCGVVFHAEHESPFYFRRRMDFLTFVFHQKCNPPQKKIRKLSKFEKVVYFQYF